MNQKITSDKIESLIKELVDEMCLIHPDLKSCPITIYETRIQQMEKQIECLVEELDQETSAAKRLYHENEALKELIKIHKEGIDKFESTTFF